MKARTVYSVVMAAGLTLMLVEAGCGGAQEEYRPVSRPLDIGAVHASPNQSEQVDLSDATRKEIKACMDRRAGQWPERSYAVQFDAKANDRREMTEVKLRGTTMQDDEVVECLQQAIAGMTVPENARHSRSSKPFSGGERMMREQRGLVGSSDSENPIVLLGPFIVEAVGAEVLIQVWVGFLAAVGTVVLAKNTKDFCADKYTECMDTPLGNIQVNKWGETVCATCQRICNDKGGWPLGVILTNRWQTCR